MLSRTGSDTLGTFLVESFIFFEVRSGIVINTKRDNGGGGGGNSECQRGCRSFYATWGAYVWRFAEIAALGGSESGRRAGISEAVVLPP
jgi:hypothetical protein